jgi:hypothetical protein
MANRGISAATLQMTDTEDSHVVLRQVDGKRLMTSQSGRNVSMLRRDGRQTIDGLTT